MKHILLTFLFLLGGLTGSAQPQSQLVKVTVMPNSSDWQYKLGDKVKFDVTVTMNNIPLENVKIRYELSYDMMPAFEMKELTLKNGKSEINAGTMKGAGFLRCIVIVTYNGKEYKGMATAGFVPETIQPTVGLPNDFLEFWNNAKAENANIPMSPKVTLLPERCTDKINVYHVSIQNYNIGSYIYGILAVPKAEGKYPAILAVPGAGVRAYGGDISTAESGIITFQIGIHGIPVTMENHVYQNLGRGALRDYAHWNWDNRDRVYYKRVYLGCVRAVDYIFSLKEFDGTNIAVRGGSQGGALAIVTTGLDNRIKALASFYPALSDITGFFNGRAGGWPQIHKNQTESSCILAEKEKNMGYYDVVNFARLISVPGFYSFGYNDMVCPPTSIYSAINVIQAEKELLIVPETGHWTYPEQNEAASGFIMKLIKK